MYCLSDLHFESLNTHIYMMWKIAVWKQMNIFFLACFGRTIVCVVAALMLLLLL